jgi:hypothetical protein
MNISHISFGIIETGQVLLKTLDQIANDRWCRHILENNCLNLLLNTGMSFIEEENRLRKMLLHYMNIFANLGAEVRDHKVLYNVRSLILDTLSCTRGTLSKLESVRKRLLHALEERERLQEMFNPYRRNIYENEPLSP